MLLPQNPKVLIIDDVYDDISGLMHALSLNGVPYIHLDGGLNSVPSRKFTSIRLVFLDIDLIGRTNGQPPKQQGSALAAYLTQIIDESTHPFFILFWTRNAKVSKHVIRYLKKSNLNLYGHLNLDKPPKSVLKKKPLSFFESMIHKAVSNDSLEFVIGWENEINRQTTLFANEISSISAADAKKRKKTAVDSLKIILSELALSYAGKAKKDFANVPGNSLPREFLKYAVAEMNASFGSNLAIDFCSSMNIELPKNYENLSVGTLAKLNKKLFFEDRINNDSPYGGIFYMRDLENVNYAGLKDAMKTDKSFKEVLKYKKEFEIVGAILTPQCDISQNKMLTDGKKTKHHRVLLGLKFAIPRTKKDCDSFLKEFKKIRGEKVFPIMPFEDENGKTCVICFHLGALTMLEKLNPIKLQLKRDLAFDLQSKLANHVNRLGNSMLEC